MDLSTEQNKKSPERRISDIQVEHRIIALRYYKEKITDLYSEDVGYIKRAIDERIEQLKEEINK